MTNEEAISILYHLKKCLNDDMFFEAIEHAVNALENEPKKGVWEFGGSCFSTTSYRCPFCKSKSLERTKFCSECGADMRETGNDNHIYEAIRSGTPYEERPKGKWITHKFNYFIFEECDQCHCKVGTINMKFCPNCGSDNREDGE